MKNQSCENCKYWGKFRARGMKKTPDISGGPFRGSKPARECKRFPPTGLWGATDNGKAHMIGQSLSTFNDDWCGEWSQAEDL